MSRRDQLARLQAAEVALADRRVVLQHSVAGRLDDLRQIHPAWLLAGGFLSGIIVHRGGAWIGYSGLASSLLPTGLRLWRLASAYILPALRQASL